MRSRSEWSPNVGDRRCALALQRPPEGTDVVFGWWLRAGLLGQCSCCRSCCCGSPDPFSEPGVWGWLCCCCPFRRRGVEPPTAVSKSLGGRRRQSPYFLPCTLHKSSTVFFSSHLDIFQTRTFLQKLREIIIFIYIQSNALISRKDYV